MVSKISRSYTFSQERLTSCSRQNDLNWSHCGSLPIFPPLYSWAPPSDIYPRCHPPSPVPVLGIRNPLSLSQYDLTANEWRETSVDELSISTWQPASGIFQLISLEFACQLSFFVLSRLSLQVGCSGLLESASAFPRDLPEHGVWCQIFGAPRFI